MTCLIQSRKVKANHTPKRPFYAYSVPQRYGDRTRKRLHFRRVVINPWKQSRDGKQRRLHQGRGYKVMRTVLAFAAGVALLSTWGQAQQHEQDRLKHSGEVLLEILNIPDNLPKYWLDRAECV